jgi:anti-sigma B factor antagonist
MTMLDLPHATDLRIEVVPDRRRVFVALIGELDLATAPAVDAQLRELRDVGFDQLVLDLRSLSFMDSSGLALILRALHAAPEGTFAIVPGAGAPERVLRLTGVLDAVPIVRERDAPRAVTA